MKALISHLKTWTTAVAVLVLTGCSSVLDKHVVWQYDEPTSFPVLRAVGYAPINSQPGDSQEIKNIMAMKASKLEAYRELAEQVYGRQVKGSSNFSNMVATDDKLRAKVQGVIRGAKIVKSYPVGNTYATELELDMKRVHDLYKINNRSRDIKKVNYY